MALLGGGPSLTETQVQQAGRFRRVAVNDAYLLAPDADLLWFCDQRWHGWHKARPEYLAFQGPRATLENFQIDEEGLLHFRNDGLTGLCIEPDGVRTGSNSGYQALNLAVNMGAKRILLLGFDMRVIGGQANWHRNHKLKMPPAIFQRMVGYWRTTVEPLKRLGVEVVNCTSGSALDFFPYRPIEEL